jgi:predicted amidohydrolase YtcJ
LLIQKFITRTDDKGRKWNVKEAVSREQALRMYTSWAARYSQDEQKLGSLEAGKLADLVVLDGDYMGVTEDKISELPVIMTIVGGKVIYDRERDGVVPIPRGRRAEEVGF